MYWLICGLVYLGLSKLFGYDRASNIMLGIAVSIPVCSLIGFFYFFVLPSQFWKNL